LHRYVLHRRADIQPDLSGTGFVVCDQGTNLVRRIAADSTVSTIAGVSAGFAGNSGTNGPATSARLFKPWAVLPETSTSLVILDRFVVGCSGMRDLT
jgi:hypothetical protein